MRNFYTVLGRTAHKTHESERSLGSSFGKVSLFLIITIIFFTSTSLKAQAPGNDCASAVALTLPAVGATITTGAQTTCGRVNDWGAGFSSVNTLYGGGLDGIYSINVPAGGGNYTFTLANSGATYKILSIHSACAPTAANTLGGFTTGSGRGGTVTLTLTAGVKYIVIDTWPNPNCGAFTLSITQNVAFTGCTSTSSFGSGNAPTAAAPNTTLTTCAYAGEYSTINSVAAATNYISTATGGASNYITIRLGSTTGALIAQGNSPLSWTSTTAGTYVQIVNTNSACGTDASCHTQIVSVPCTPSGNPATYGTNAWIGYVYDAAAPGAFTTYKGFVNEATTFDRTHTTIAAGATASHCSQNQDLFTIRYRNTANLAAGYYTFSVGGDDGVRFSIDGGATWLINNWVDQGYTVSSNPTPVYLSGNVNMVFEYYENTGGARSSFSYIFTPACSGTPTPGNTIASVTSVLSGGTSNLSLQNATAPATYQWQSSTSSTGPWTNIGGATSATYTATVTANTYYQCVVTCTASSTSAASAPVQVTLITPPVNDACANSTDLPCGTSSLAGTTVNAVSETAPLGYSSPYGVWYSFVGDGQPSTISSTAVFDHEMTIMTGSSCGSYTIVSSQDNAVSNGTETYTFNTIVGTQYYVYLAHYSTTSTTTGTFTISRSCVPPTPPVNDACSNATALPCGTSALAGTTVNAVSETAPLGYSSPYGVWYSFIGDGQSTTISSFAVFDHEMTIMTGTSCGAYTIVSSQDNAVSNGTETYTFNTIVGTQYYVYLAHYSTTSTTTGTFTISRSCLAPLANDNCSNAEAISIQCPASATAISGNTAAATEEAGILDPNCDPGTMKDVWYVFNSGVNTSVNLTVTLGTATWLGGQLFTTCGVEATGVSVGGNVGNCDFYVLNPSPTVISGLVPNTDYRLRLFTNVDWDVAGTFTFTLTTNVPTVNISTASSTICNGNQVTLTGAVVSNSTWTVNLSNGQSATGTGSANWSVTTMPSSTATYTVSSLTGPQCPAVISGTSTITLPTAGSALAQDNENATCIVNQNGWVHFYHSSGRLIASVNSQGQDLGSVTATSYVEGAPVSVDACGNANPIYATTVMGRHWVITPTNQPTSAVLVRLPYENTEFSDLTSAASTNANTNDDLLTPSDLGLSKYSNGTNTNVNDVATDNCGVGATTFHTQTGNGAATSYSSVNASYADFSIPGFSEFWLHGSAQSSPLPVELVNFQANCAGEGKVNVTWATASEHNSANFTVEKSRDGMNWIVLASVAGAGNSTQMINYSTVDNNAAAGVNYYRLTQTDFDGASETFNIASANCGDNSPLTTVKVYPNPSAGDFYIDFNSEEIIGSSVITITDARGMEVYKTNVTVEKGSNVFHIENMEAAPGIYYIQVSNGTATSNIVKHSLR